MATEPTTPSGVFDAVAAGGHEQVVFCHDPESGLRAIIAIWSTALGPSLGGTRFLPYPSEADALADVLHLSRAMGYKNATAGLDLGGGKAVIMGDPRRHRSEALMRAYGRFVDSLGGRFLTAEDVGTTQADMDLVGRETPYVAGTSRGAGDPSPVTAVGVHAAIRAAAAEGLGTADLAGRHVAIQGLGKVGRAVARLVHDDGARLSVADVDVAAVVAAEAGLGAEAVPPEKIHAVDCDIFSPCALGGSLSPDTVPELRCRVICGAANNQMTSDAVAEAVAERGIIAVPDFVANAGGVINIAEELAGYDHERALQRVRRIYETTTAVIAAAAEAGITPLQAARRMAEDRIASVSRLSRIRAGRVDLRSYRERT